MAGNQAEKVKIACKAMSSIPREALEGLAGRFRPSGVFLVVLRCDGSIAFHDPSAAGFFHRYVLPILQRGHSVETEFSENLLGITPESGVVLWQFVPGVLIAAFPYLDRKNVSSIVLLAVKSPSFKLSEDVVRLCSCLGLDAIWLDQQAHQLTAYDEQEVLRHGRLLQNMVRDQVQLAGLEHELDSFSAHLSSTYEELSLVYQLSGGMRVNRSPADYFKQVCHEVMEVIEVRGMGVALRSEKDVQPLLYGPLSLPATKMHRLADELLASLRQRPAALLVNNLHEDSSFRWLCEHARRLLAVPLVRREQVIGCLFALDKSSGEFDTIDSKLLSAIANQSAIYLENSMLYEDLRDLMMGMMRSLVSAVDAKDAYTCGHSERVALLSRVLATEAKLQPQVIEHIYMAGLLHDVGKIGVPEAVLQKTGKLTTEEFELVKKHPEIGAKILQDIKQLREIIPGVMHHHERYDGKGYPFGLSGEQIPLMGRIICLADCLDAMTSSRTYRKAMPLEVALTEIRRCSGTQFDPVLTDVFLSIGIDRLRELMLDHKRQAKELIQVQQVMRAA